MNEFNSFMEKLLANGGFLYPVKKEMNSWLMSYRDFSGERNIELDMLLGLTRDFCRQEGIEMRRTKSDSKEYITFLKQEKNSDLGINLSNDFIKNFIHDRFFLLTQEENLSFAESCLKEGFSKLSGSTNRELTLLLVKLIAFHEKVEEFPEKIGLRKRSKEEKDESVEDFSTLTVLEFLLQIGKKALKEEARKNQISFLNE